MNGKTPTITDLARIAEEQEKNAKSLAQGYLESLPNWIPIRHRKDAAANLEELSKYLGIPEIAELIRRYYAPIFEEDSESQQNQFYIPSSWSISRSVFMRLFTPIAEIELAITLGEERGVRMLDGEDRKKNILSQSGKNAVISRLESRDKVIFFAETLARESLQESKKSLEDISHDIARDVVEYSKTLPGNVLRSIKRAPRTILEWLQKAASEGRL
jgi:hypothetical protein